MTQSTNLKLDLLSATDLFDTDKIKSNFEKIDNTVLIPTKIIDNCVTDNSLLPLSAKQGKLLQDQITKLNGDLTNSLNHKKQILPWGTYRDGNYPISNFKFGLNLYIAVGASSKVQKRCSIIAANDSIQIPHPEGFITIVFNDTNHITVSGTTDNYQLREIRASDLLGV